MTAAAEQEAAHRYEKEQHQVPRELEAPERILNIRDAEPHEAERKHRHERQRSSQVRPEESQEHDKRRDEDRGAEQNNYPLVEVCETAEPGEEQIRYEEP